VTLLLKADPMLDIFLAPRSGRRGRRSNEGAGAR
jgi:hypothetical protein